MNEVGADELLYYAARKAQDDRAVRVGWRDQLAQERRFQQLAKVIAHRRDDAFTIADLGCGFGDLALFLQGAGYSAMKYMGYDRLAEMVSEAAASHPLRKFVHVADASEIDAADYCVASGIFNLKFCFGDADWLDHILPTFNILNERSRHGFAFNMLTRYSDAEHMRPELYYADPGRIFDHCKTHFSRNVALLHDYDEYEFTIIVRKDG